MKQGRTWGLSRRGTNRNGLTVVSAAVVMAGIVIAVGAVGFVVLNAVGATHSHESSSTSCSPPNLPQCRGVANATSARAAGDASPVEVAR